MPRQAATSNNALICEVMEKPKKKANRAGIHCNRTEPDTLPVNRQKSIPFPEKKRFTNKKPAH